jgi:hypothetical protein
MTIFPSEGYLRVRFRSCISKTYRAIQLKKNIKALFLQGFFYIFTLFKVSYDRYPYQYDYKYYKYVSCPEKLEIIKD